MSYINSIAPAVLTASQVCSPNERHGRVTTVRGMTNPDFQARWLDRLADAELQHGHHARAEALATRAAEMRGFV